MIGWAAGVLQEATNHSFTETASIFLKEMAAMNDYCIRHDGKSFEARRDALAGDLQRASMNQVPQVAHTARKFLIAVKGKRGYVMVLLSSHSQRIIFGTTTFK